MNKLLKTLKTRCQLSHELARRTDTFIVKGSARYQSVDDVWREYQAELIIQNIKERELKR